MSEWFDNQKKPKSNLRKLLQERIEKANPRRNLTAEEAKRLAKLEGIADKLRRKNFVLQFSVVEYLQKLGGDLASPHSSNC